MTSIGVVAAELGLLVEALRYRRQAEIKAVRSLIRAWTTEIEDWVAAATSEVADG
jgi:hypothetical protein